MIEKDGELGVIVDVKLHAANDFVIWGEREPLRGFDKMACWMNGWLPFGIRLGAVDGRRRFFRL